LPYQTQYQTSTLIALILAAICVGYAAGASEALDEPVANFRFTDFELAARPRTDPLPSTVLWLHQDHSVTSVLSWPLIAYRRLSSPYGNRIDPISGQLTFHQGLDFSASEGAPIHAASCGIVKKAGFHSGYGYMVDLDHGKGLVTRYAHARSVLVSKGQIVGQGEVIGHVGSTGASTGAHLHFEVRVRERAVDPTRFLTGQLMRAPITARASTETTASPSLR
jgi:murein DD-endopeptidase MepM/ murein hydrolase activator NlpD